MMSANTARPPPTFWAWTSPNRPSKLSLAMLGRRMACLTLKIAAKTEALVFDPVYSGKGLAGLLALIRGGRWTENDNVIFIHTGGEPALFAYRECLGLQ
jgi:hypothetical protein